MNEFGDHNFEIINSFFLFSVDDFVHQHRFLINYRKEKTKPSIFFEETNEKEEFAEKRKFFILFKNKPINKKQDLFDLFFRHRTTTKKRKMLLWSFLETSLFFKPNFKEKIKLASMMNE